MIHLAKFFTILALAGWAEAYPGDPAPERAIRVVVFEQLFSEHIPQSGGSEWILFVGIGKEGQRRKGPVSDPDADLLRLLRDGGWAAQPASQAAPFGIATGVKDAKSGQRGLWFYVGSIEWTGPGQASVYGEFYQHGKSAEGASYRVVQQGDAWKVVSRTSIWKS